MRGHLQIIAARMAGFKPTTVSFEMHDVPHGSLLEQYSAESVHKSVIVEAGDRADLADLRFVVGLSCYVIGEREAQVKAWAAACKKAGAGRITAAVVTIKNQSVANKNEVELCTF